MKDRKAYLEELKSQFRELDIEIDRLRKKAGQNAEAKAKSEYMNLLDELASKRESTQAKFQELEKATEGTWDKVRIDMKKNWDELKQAVSSAVSKVK